MTVRWKPLILLSTLFLVVGVLGVVAFTFAFMPPRSQDLLTLARSDWKANRFEKSQIQFQRALQADPKNAAIHRELARMYADWSEAVPAERPRLRPLRLKTLADAIKHDKKDDESYRLLLGENLASEEWAEATHFANGLIAIRPDDSEAHFALAADALLDEPARPADALPHVVAIEKSEPDGLRSAWTRAAWAEKAGDEAALTAVLDKARGRLVSGKDETSIPLTRLRLLSLDVTATTDPSALTARVSAFRDEAKRLAGGEELPPTRITRLGRLLESVQKHVATVSARDEATKARLSDVTPALEELAEAIYKKAADPKASPDPRVYLAYANHLLFRERREECLAVIDRALASPMASLPAWLETTMQIREVAIKAALSDLKDPKRRDKVAPHIDAMIKGSNVRYQALGHLFQGILDLERSGLAVEAAAPGAEATSAKIDPALRASALANLRKAAEGLPEVSTARALYGVSLLLSDEDTLGRQYLQEALRLGNLEPRYQVWAAWSMIQAGYPEEAQPIIEGMLAAVEQGKLGPDLAGPLHLLNGESHQARRTPADLKIARAEFDAAIKAGTPSTPALQLRMAQVDVLLGKKAEGQGRIEELRSQSKGGPAAEQMSILLLREQGKLGEAVRRLAEARAKYPESDELVALDAALLVEAKKPEDAGRVLAEFVAKYPTHTDTALLRARLLASELKRPDEARKILAALAEKTDNSAPLIQLALLDLGQGRLEAVPATIAKIRSRWKESAAGDLLDAQLALAKNNAQDAVKYLDFALKKDPANKLALFWKAQLEERIGAVAEAAKIYEEIERDRPVKEVDPGLSLGTAAKWALATQALDNQDFDGAIARFEDILKRGVTDADLSRSARWRVVQAKAAKGDWKGARADMAPLLTDPKLPSRERLQAANLYRLNKDYKSSREQLYIILREDPSHSQAVAVAAFLLADEKRPADAAALIRKAMAVKTQPPSIYLMLAAIENLTPAPDAFKRALGVIDEGLKVHGDSVEMVRAKSRVTRLATGDPAKAIAVVEERAKSDEKDGRFRRLLADVYREENRLVQAEAVVRSLQKENPDDALLMAALVRTVASEATEAGAKGDRAGEKKFNDETAKLLSAFRAKKPKDIVLAEAECDLAARQGNLARAVAITEEIDKLDPNSPVGPLLRAKIQTARGDTDGVASAYDEAAQRAPRRIDIRMAQAQSSINAGRTDEALKQAEFVLESDRDRVDAIVLKARALSLKAGADDRGVSFRDRAVADLQAALAKKPANAGPIVHLLAEIQYRSGRRDQAIATLSSSLQSSPGDENGVAMLAQILTEPRPEGPAPPAEMKRAMEMAQSIGDRDKKGNLCLALAVGFHKAGQIDLAFAWAERAASKLDLPIVHLNYGDILLSKAEATSEPDSARDLFEKAVAQYDLVLKAQANSIEAVNNKAWILHRHLNRNADALSLAEGFSRRLDASSLPPEFHDTLGAIYEAARRRGDAEASYEKGLKQAPDHPVLNYHMGRLLSADPARKAKAASYIEKALAGRERLGATMASEAEGLLKTLGG